MDPRDEDIFQELDDKHPKPKSKDLEKDSEVWSADNNKTEQDEKPVFEDGGEDPYEQKVLDAYDHINNGEQPEEETVKDKNTAEGSQPHTSPKKSHHKKTNSKSRSFGKVLDPISPEFIKKNEPIDPVVLTAAEQQENNKQGQYDFNPPKPDFHMGPNNYQQLAAGAQPYRYDPPATSWAGIIANRRLVRIVFSAFMVILLLILVLIFVLPKFKSEKLIIKNEQNFSILVPQKYNKVEESGYINYEEEDKDSTQSSVILGVDDLGVDLKSEDKDTYLKSLEQIFKDPEVGGLVKSGQKLGDYQIQKITYKGQDAKLIDTTITDGNKNVGKLKLIFGIHDQYVFVVALRANNGDKAFQKSIDKIIDSLEFK